MALYDLYGRLAVTVLICAVNKLLTHYQRHFSSLWQMDQFTGDRKTRTGPS